MIADTGGDWLHVPRCKLAGEDLNFAIDTEWLQASKDLLASRRLIGSSTLLSHAKHHRAFADILFPNDKCIDASAECVGGTDLPAEQRLMCML